jgi:hypothetical protein
VLCALARGAWESMASKNTIAIRRKAERKAESERWDIVNSPLFFWTRKFLFRCRFFEVAAFPKPYYNPANLEKVGTGVKQK